MSSVLTEEHRARLKQRFLSLAKSLKKSNPELATRLEARVERLISWYAENMRNITNEELRKILCEEAKPPTQ